MSLWRHVRAIGLLPLMAAAVIPAVIVLRTGSQVGWGLPQPARAVPIVLGLSLIGVGLSLLVRTIGLFATVGQGTLAPWDATRRLVVKGVYRHVRNPMISGVFCVITGEAVLLGSPPLFAWALAFLGLNAVYMPLIEEPGLVRRFGGEYAEYKEHVPRWLPRLRAWEPPFVQA